jgi:hypothetical protein
MIIRGMLLVWFIIGAVDQAQIRAHADSAKC